ncbi:hypothetical protein MKX01_000571 [Papaver californicum]|nr:hypothetical protein MKX01_000571 [Papaver californicum]
MKFGWDLKIGLNRYMTSWKNVNDPSAGDYSYGVDLARLPEFVLRNGSVNRCRSGVWNGVRFSGFQNFRPNGIFSYTVVINTDEVYAGWVTEGNGPSVTTRELLKLNEGGKLERFSWDKQSMERSDMTVLPRDL